MTGKNKFLYTYSKQFHCSLKKHEGSHAVLTKVKAGG